MENIYENVLAVKKIKIVPQQVLLDNNVLIEGQEEVTKILSVGTSVDIERPIEMLIGECLIVGKLKMNVVYVNADNEINTMESISNFSHKLQNEFIDANSKINVFAHVANTEIDTMVNNQVKILTTVNIEATILQNQEIKFLKDSDTNTCVRQEEKNIAYLELQKCDKFEESLEATVKNGVRKILLVNSDVVVKEWTSGYNFVSVEGEIYTKILYADKQEISELQTITITKQFKQEIEIENCSKETNLDVFASILGEGVRAEIDEKEDSTQITVINPVIVCVNSYCNNKILAINDIYSTSDVLSISNSQFENSNNLDPEFLEGKVEGNVTLSENDLRIDKYLATTNVCATVSNSYIQNGELKIEGVVTANVVYLNDETSSVQSVEIELPFVLDKKTDYDENVILEPIVTLWDIDVMVKRGREIYFDAKAKVYVNASEVELLNIISDVSSLGKVDAKDSSIEIYFGKEGETLWEIAKNLKIPAEIIKNQNPNVNDPLTQDENIALYYQKQRN